MEAILAEARILKRQGTLDTNALNPQIKAVLDIEENQNILQRLGDMVKRRGGVNRFNMTVKADSQPEPQAQPGPFQRRVVSIY